MSKPSLNIIRSPTAEEMLRMVSQGFYDRSYIALWIFEVIGREYDDMSAWAQELKREIFIQTCTWSVGIWEWVYGISTNPQLTLEQRRAQILAQQLRRPPINPAQIESVISAFTGCPVKITDPEKPYTFALEINESNAKFPVDYKAARELLNQIKPSHLAAVWSTIISAEYSVTDYDAGTTAEIIYDFQIGDETPIITAADDVYAGVTSEVIQDYHIGDNTPIMTDSDEICAGVASETITEFYVESSPIVETANDMDVCAMGEVMREYHSEEATTAAKRGKAYELFLEVLEDEHNES